jgi:hypothetical protein
MTKCCRCVAITMPLFLVVAMQLLPCSTVSGQEIRAVAQECMSDVSIQCTGVKPGGGRIRECIKTHLKDLSEPCQTVVLKAVTVKACAADVTQQCAGTQPGGGSIEACMKTHLADVSEPCKEALARSVAGRQD